ncbi:hypothetical protein J6590_003348 [Homalodisca vitripennis]|nr:hypothetical protein J6590_003348 [Homalodisca vitripennis]
MRPEVYLAIKCGTIAITDDLAHSVTKGVEFSLGTAAGTRPKTPIFMKTSQAELRTRTRTYTHTTRGEHGSRFATARRHRQKSRAAITKDAAYCWRVPAYFGLPASSARKTAPLAHLHHSQCL